jgi:exopolyphosphatase/guanosine-5'-triphosphate,3'-diphosphate pyrophosphatase
MMLKVAAIDVGSNAIRMMVGEVNDLWIVKVINNIRIPVRLGGGVFKKGMLDETSMRQTVDAFRRFQHVAKDFGVHRMRTVGTSAMREADNAQVLIDRIDQASGINVEIIDGN